MKLVKKGEGTKYEADKHFGVWGIQKLLAGQDTQRITVNLSVFLPEGGAAMSSSLTEKFYYVLGGTLAITGKSEEYVLQKDDAIYIAPGEEREMRVLGSEPCTVLVVIAKVN